ncbi:thymidylate synthase [Roseobacter phage CRP-345]|nr:thymidylate synthase [Roseobacter phage CRP-345]
MIEVKYIDHMGSDISVVNAARVSFGKRSAYIYAGYDTNGIPDRSLDPKDAKLINYLAKHNHKSPFNHTFATFHVKAPIFVARQLVKHEYMPWNEISRRYVDDPPDFFKPDYWRGRAENVKQGSSGEVKSNANVAYQYHKMEGLYKQLLDEGVCPEQARMILPQSMMTEWYWSGTLYAFAKMCQLRCAKDTQQESREVAMQVSEHMEKLFPVAWEALWEHGT